MSQSEPTTITQFHELLLKHLPVQLPSWQFEFSIYLNNKYSRPEEFEQKDIPSRYMFTLKLSYLNNGTGSKMISIINNNKSIITTIPNGDELLRTREAQFSRMLDSDEEEGDADDENQHQDQQQQALPAKLDKLFNHLQNGCCNNLPLSSSNSENLDTLLIDKLQSLWNLKQTIKGNDGLGFLLKVELASVSGNAKVTEKFKIRTANCKNKGNFKGLLIEIEHLNDEENSRESSTASDSAQSTLIKKFQYSLNRIHTLINELQFPQGNLSYNVLSDRKLDHWSDLCQQYCDALQL